MANFLTNFLAISNLLGGCDAGKASVGFFRKVDRLIGVVHSNHLCLECLGGIPRHRLRCRDSDTCGSRICNFRYFRAMNFCKLGADIFRYYFFPLPSEFILPHFAYVAT